MSSKLVTSKELSTIISVPIYTIRKLTRNGMFPAYKIGGKGYLYDPQEILEVIKGLKYTINNSIVPMTATDTQLGGN